METGRRGDGETGRRCAPLDAAELLVALLRELALHADHGLEARVEVGHALVEQLRDLGDELPVEHLEHLARVVELLLGLRRGADRRAWADGRGGDADGYGQKAVRACM